MAIKIDHQQNLLKTQTNELKLDITGSLTLPSGATSDRSGSPNTGDIRFNTSLTQFEGYNGSAWGEIANGVPAGSVFSFATSTVPTGYLECNGCLLYTSPSPRDVEESRMPSSA